MRMAFAARSDTELVQALKKLAQTTDAAFYSNRSNPSALDYAPMIRRRIGAAVRKQFLLEIRERMCARKSVHS